MHGVQICNNACPNMQRRILVVPQPEPEIKLIILSNVPRKTKLKELHSWNISILQIGITQMRLPLATWPQLISARSTQKEWSKMENLLFSSKDQSVFQFWNRKQETENKNQTSFKFASIKLLIYFGLQGKDIYRNYVHFARPWC